MNSLTFSTQLIIYENNTILVIFVFVHIYKQLLIFMNFLMCAEQTTCLSVRVITCTLKNHISTIQTILGFCLTSAHSRGVTVFDKCVLLTYSYNYLPLEVKIYRNFMQNNLLNTLVLLKNNKLPYSMIGNIKLENYNSDQLIFCQRRLKIV